MGYTQVEGYSAVYGDAAAFRKMLDQAGLTMPSGHFALDELERDFGAVDAIATTLGISRIFCPYLAPEARPADRAGWEDLAKRLTRIGRRAAGAGYGFGWHNHDFEFTPCREGEIPMRILLEAVPELDWEADIAWIARAGTDPLDWIATYGHRMTAAHIKDIAATGENADEDGWADLGAGVLDWPVLHMALIRSGVDLFVIEHDNPSDLDRFASRSIASFTSSAGAVV